MTGNILFQSKISVNVFKVKIYILKEVKCIAAFVFILQETKSIIKSNWDFGVHLAPIKYVKPRPRGKSSALSLHESRNDMSEARLDNFWNLHENEQNITEIICRVEWGKKVGKNSISFSTKGEKKVVLNRVGVALPPCPHLQPPPSVSATGSVPSTAFGHFCPFQSNYASLNWLTAIVGFLQCTTGSTILPSYQPHSLTTLD